MNPARSQPTRGEPDHVQILVFAALLFLPIGTWRWPRAIQFLVAMGGLSLVTTIAMARMAPASLEARVKKASAKNQPKADRVISLFLALTHISWFIVIPTDVFRWQLLPTPPPALSAFAVAVALLGYGIMLMAVWQNPYATPIVGDQSERGQVVVDTGVYRHVRHPMYLGHLLFLLGLPLWLESSLGALLVPLVFAPLIARIVIEEKTLVESLPGYAGYRERVPFRLIPFLW